MRTFLVIDHTTMEEKLSEPIELILTCDCHGASHFVLFLGVGKNFRLLMQSCCFFCFLGVGKNFRLLMQSCCFFFSRPFHENFKFLKNCPYDFHEILHSHSTPKGAPACAKASKSYDWNVRNIAKNGQNLPKNSLFSISSKTVHTIRTKFSTVILHHIRVLYVQWHQNRIAGM